MHVPLAVKIMNLFAPSNHSGTSQAPSALSRRRDFGQILFPAFVSGTRTEKGGHWPPFAQWCCKFATYQEPAPLSVVTARRFCDQQEMSSQTATGRSLP